MEDEQVSDIDVAAETTEVEMGPVTIPELTDPDITQAIPELTEADVQQALADRQASLDDIKNLPAFRKAKAVPFTIPGTGLVVKVAPTTANASYKSTMLQLNAASVTDDDERMKLIRAMSNGLVQSCVVEPELDEEALEALNAFNGTAYLALVQKCRDVSDLDTAADTDVAEAFS